MCFLKSILIIQKICIVLKLIFKGNIAGEHSSAFKHSIDQNPYPFYHVCLRSKHQSRIKRGAQNVRVWVQILQHLLHTFLEKKDKEIKMIWNMGSLINAGTSCTLALLVFASPKYNVLDIENGNNLQ